MLFFLERCFYKMVKRPGPMQLLSATRNYRTQLFNTAIPLAGTFLGSHGQMQGGLRSVVFILGNRAPCRKAGVLLLRKNETVVLRGAMTHLFFAIFLVVSP